jgi:Glycosyl hydrolases family 16
MTILHTRGAGLLLAGLLAVLIPALQQGVGAAAPPGPATRGPAAVADQQGTAVALPPVAQQGAVPAAPMPGALVSTLFRPAVPGRTVHLQELVSRRWRTVQSAAQDGSGHAVFTVPVGRTYRAVAHPGGASAAIPTAPVVSRSWRLAFEDTFAGSELGAAWRDSVRPYHPTGGRTCARPDTLARTVAGGVLQLGVRLDPARSAETCTYVHQGLTKTSPWLLNSQVDTQGRYAFRYGHAAARMKLHRPRGMHDAFWMNPAGGFVNGDPSKGAEVDVVEFFNGEKDPPTGVGAFVHVKDAAGAWDKRGAMFPATELMKPLGDTWWTSYHVFSVEWTPTAYVFRVDGREFFRLAENVSQAEHYLLLSMLTSDYELEHLDGSDFAATASVDWVRVWQ